MVQGELDDLLMVFGDLEERCEGYKEQLKALGENVSDVEEDEADEGDEGDEDSNESADESETRVTKEAEDDVD